MKKKIENAGKEIKRADEVQFLGNLIDDRLSFKNHVSGLHDKVSMATGMLNMVSNMVSVEVKLKSYYSLIYSKLIYVILSWGKSFHGNKVTLERIIKHAWRVIPYINSDMCKSLLNFEYMFKYFIGVEVL